MLHTSVRSTEHAKLLDEREARARASRVDAGFAVAPTVASSRGGRVQPLRADAERDGAPPTRTASAPRSRRRRALTAFGGTHYSLGADGDGLDKRPASARSRSASNNLSHFTDRRPSRDRDFDGWRPTTTSSPSRSRPLPSSPESTRSALTRERTADQQKMPPRKNKTDGDRFGLAAGGQRPERGVDDALRAKQRREKAAAAGGGSAEKAGFAADRTRRRRGHPAQRDERAERREKQAAAQGARNLGMFATKEEAIQALMRDKRDRGMTAEQRRDRPARGATFRDHESAHQEMMARLRPKVAADATSPEPGGARARCRRRSARRSRTRSPSATG